jgi:hypothetical protein
LVCCYIKNNEGSPDAVEVVYYSGRKVT